MTSAGITRRRPFVELAAKREAQIEPCDRRRHCRQRDDAARKTHRLAERVEYPPRSGIAAEVGNGVDEVLRLLILFWIDNRVEHLHGGAGEGDGALDGHDGDDDEKRRRDSKTEQTQRAPCGQCRSGDAHFS